MARARAAELARPVAAALVLVGVALVLRNVWAWLHWQIPSSPRRGGRALRPERLRLAGLLPWLQHVIEDEFGA